ncbi:MAG: HDOD domain-containing protein [Steroidobacteraceae bacterium]
MSAQPETEKTINRNTFGFVQKLADELSTGRVNLPGIPEVALRIQRLLNDDNTSIDLIVRAVNAEPTLALQIMRMANSAALSSGAAQAYDVRAAVMRIGSKMIRAAALSFLVQQLKNTEELLPLRERLNILWQRAIAVGVTGRALASRMNAVVPDAALLAGLLHVVGRLYIMTRLQRLPVQERQAAEEGIKDWSGTIGKALLENWEMPEEYGEAIGNYANPERDSKGATNLTDILAAANALADLLPGALAGAMDEALFERIQQRHADLWRRTRRSAADCRDAVLIAARDAQEFRTLFGA